MILVEVEQVFQGRYAIGIVDVSRCFRVVVIGYCTTKAPDPGKGIPATQATFSITVNVLAQSSNFGCSGFKFVRCGRSLSETGFGKEVLVVKNNSGIGIQGQAIVFSLVGARCEWTGIELALALSNNVIG
jgi:hypothetical protein